MSYECHVDMFSTKTCRFIVIFVFFPFNARAKTDSDSEYSFNYQKSNENKRGSNVNSKSTHFEIRAILVKCSYTECPVKPSLPRHLKLQKSVKYVKESDVKKLNNTDLYNQKLEKCKKKIIVTAQLHNTGIPDCKNQYIVIDHVYDPFTECKVRLFNPYIIKVRQHPVLESYKLIFDQTINSKAREEVHNKEEPGYDGCHVTGKNPTCEPIVHNGLEVPYSRGFCCPCDKKSNEMTDNDFASRAKIQLEVDGLAADINNYNEDLQNATLHALHVPGMISAASRGALMTSLKHKCKTKFPHKRHFARKNREKRMLMNDIYNHRQIRGGQNCEDKYTPPNVDQESYHDSAHCLKFSDVWYSAYNFEQPTLQHSVEVQILEKFEDENCNVRWHDLSKGIPLVVGTKKLHDQSSGPTMLATYSSKTCPDNITPNINFNQKMILIPDTMKGENILEYPELTGGPPEYLVVPKSAVSSNGKECNKAGVGFEGFNKQPHRCSVPRGSCLNNQPSDFWRQDHFAESEGLKGSYFLKFYGHLPKKPIKEGCDHTQILTIYHECAYSSAIELEFKADYNTALRPNGLAIISEVSIDSTCGSATNIKAKVMNSGLVTSIFYISLSNCPLDMPASFNNIASKPALIPPQQQHIFNLNVQCVIPETAFYCTMNVLNTKQEMIAARRIKIQPFDRCICAWYCSCSCLNTDGDMKCVPVTLESFNSVGYQGSLPVSIQLVEYTFIDDVLSIILYLSLFLCSTLLLMGLTKALLGLCCCIVVGHWGFDVLLDLPRKLGSYHEEELVGRPVAYNTSGWPVHPDSGKRVRNVPAATEFCLNMIFFFIYPVMLLKSMFSKLCGTKYTKEGCDKCFADGKDWCHCKTGNENCTCIPYNNQGPTNRETKDKR